MAIEAPAFVRCTLAVAHLARFEVFPIRDSADGVTLAVIVDLDPAWTVWGAEEAIAGTDLPSGVILSLDVRLPTERRLTFEGKVPSGPRGVGDAARLVASMLDRLIAHGVS